MSKREKPKKKNAESRPDTKTEKPGLPEEHSASKLKGFDDIAIFGLGLLSTVLFVLFGVLYGTHKTSSIWVLFFPSCLVLTFAVYLFWQKFTYCKRWPFIVVANLLFLTCWFWQNPTRSHPDAEPYAETIETAFVGVKRDTQDLFCEYNQNMLSPVPVALFLNVINLQEVSSTVDELRVDIQLESKHWLSPATWLQTETIPEYMQLIWIQPPPSPSRLVTLVGPRLEPILESKTLQPHETVRGWVLLDVPPEYDSAERPLTFRVTIRDTAGRTFTKHDRVSPEGGNIFPPRGFNIEGEANITGFHVRHISDARH